MAAGRPDLGPPGLHPADEGWLAADRGRLRGRDLPGRLPALTPSWLAMGAVAVALLLAAAAAPAADPDAGRPQGHVRAPRCGSCAAQRRGPPRTSTGR